MTRSGGLSANDSGLAIDGNFFQEFLYDVRFLNCLKTPTDYFRQCSDLAFHPSQVIAHFQQSPTRNLCYNLIAEGQLLRQSKLAPLRRPFLPTIRPCSPTS